MTKEERREAMPLCSAFIDDLREHFGDPAYIKASEGGHSVEWGVSEVRQQHEIPARPR